MALKIKNLLKPEMYDHPVDSIELVETHISWVLLTGQFAYKIKKPVNFGFLDFSTLDKRKLYCEEELRLNRRLAPDLYLEVVSIFGSEDNPVLKGQGPAIEYAVKMRQFPQSSQLDRLLEAGGLDSSIIDKLAAKVAYFHLSNKSAEMHSGFGDLEHIREPVLENFKHIRASINDSNIEPMVYMLESWSKQQLDELADAIRQRKQQGFVRECHGDMHLRNIALWDDDVIIFDCIEFNPNFYWIDVISEIAFLIMDLEDRNQSPLAQRFLNSYLEITGDYEGVRLLRFYKVYRAMVRAKVDALRTSQEQPGSLEYKQTVEDFLQYLNLAERYTFITKPCLLINHGLSGSGKTFATRKILKAFPAIHIRSDIERKRLYQQDEDRDAFDGVNQGIYTPEATRRTYGRLVEIAQILLASGYSVVIDAANLKLEQRQLFVELAKGLHSPYLFLNFHAPLETLKKRIRQRAQLGHDASDATLEILEHQLETHEQLTEEEKPFVIDVNTEHAINVNKIIKDIQTDVVSVES